jgi:flagellin-like hook-associated protein FlgL
MLTRGATAGSWTLTNHAQYPNMIITSPTNANTVTIDADGTGTDVITLSTSGNWNASDTASFSIAGGKVSPNITVHGPGTVDLLATLNALKTALQNHDTSAVSAQIDNLSNVQTQVLERQTEGGSKADSLNLTSSNLISLNDQITTMKSGVEDIDQAKIIMSFQMEAIALQASYELAAQIGKLSIVNYLT